MGAAYVYQEALLLDDFEDGALASDWSFPVGSWAESEGAMIGIPTAQTARALADPAFSGCDACTVEAGLEMTDGTGSPAAISAGLLAWYAGPGTNVSVTLKPEQDRLIFRQKEDGVVVGQGTVALALEQDTVHEVRITFDGSDFQVFLDEVLVLERPNRAAGTPLGTVGFESRNATVHVHVLTVIP